MNPMQLLKMKSAWDRFRAAHPKFPLFLNSVMQDGIREGTILEFTVTEPDGRRYCSNLKISQEDLALQIGIDVKTFARIERAEVHTNLEILDCISRGTGTTPAQLLTPLYQGIPVASVHNKLPA